MEFLSGNRIELLETGGEYFPALLAAIGAAQREVHLETYIFESDATGRAVAAALAQAAARGVTVRVLVDGFGARGFRQGLGQQLLRAGVEVLEYRPEVALFRLRRHRLRRMHRKLVVVDGAMAFVGGINVIDDTAGMTSAPPRYDCAVRIQGPLLAPIHGALRHLWRLVRWARLGRRPPEPQSLPLDTRPAGTVTAAFCIRDNLRHRRDIEEAYLQAIERAQKTIVLANAYFLPGRRFRRALLAAAARGVVVTVLLQGRVEYLLQHLATQALYGQWLEGGVRIFEYQRSFLHAKVAVVDGQWATVGSSNIDPFSLLLSREANVVIRDEGFAARLDASLHRAMTTGAREIPAQAYTRRSWIARMLAWGAYGMVRLLVGITRYGGREYGS